MTNKTKTYELEFIYQVTSKSTFPPEQSEIDDGFPGTVDYHKYDCNLNEYVEIVRFTMNKDHGSVKKLNFYVNQMRQHRKNNHNLHELSYTNLTILNPDEQSDTNQEELNTEEQSDL